MPAPAGPTVASPHDAADRTPAPLAGGTRGPRALRPLLGTVLDALDEGAAARRGPLPAGGPEAVTARVRARALPVLPETGTGAHEALHTLVAALAEGAADPAHPHCAAHLHCPPLALAAAADLAAAALNPSLDSWDQAPAATALEALTTRALASLAYPRHPAPDALVTTGGTESNQLALLLAREAARDTPGETAGGTAWAAARAAAGQAARRPAREPAPGSALGSAPEPTGRTTPPLRIVCGANAHHSIHRAAWLLGLPTPLTLPTPTGILDPALVHTALTDPGATGTPTLVIATAGTTDTGRIDPLPALAALCHTHGARLHIDASYGGPLLFSDALRPALAGLDRAHTIAVDLHKLGWQPVAAGLLAVPDSTALHPLAHHTDYLNAPDDTRAGHPDLLGRSLRTTRRPDILKIAVTLRALGRRGLGDLVERVCAAARQLADLIDAHPGFDLYARPTLSTVLFRPTPTDDHTTAALRRTLLHHGHAVLGRTTTPEGLWLKATLLNPHTTPDDLRTLLTLVEGQVRR
ncbi:aspartate aminotransferase family protein [Streptomyces rectiverticillatus]|uniref:pyridoxal phosphate-dependent decarboxylase family protein n=1 Tax=Streptomyces rectiverticillatus TaxID=173860 RepID=UPI0015C2F5A4|nr:pyridoxal-dependent decarboxylase [Streptomyces rectiverticillatus]QLE71617.1 aspartate aminotransferase family protein [Streptomyces rectiverticillatus]